MDCSHKEINKTKKESKSGLSPLQVLCNSEEKLNSPLLVSSHKVSEKQSKFK
jgi:hypothetical protein